MCYSTIRIIRRMSVIFVCYSLLFFVVFFIYYTKRITKWYDKTKTPKILKMFWIKKQRGSSLVALCILFLEFDGCVIIYLTKMSISNRFEEKRANWREKGARALQSAQLNFHFDRTISNHHTSLTFRCANF